MQLTISAETAIRFDVQIEHDGTEAWAVLEMNGGAWYLNRDGAKRWMASRNVIWPEALKRACLWLAGEAGCDAIGSFGSLRE